MISTKKLVYKICNKISTMDTDILNTFYPVGSYYETSDTSFNPNSSWGGTWILETEGQVHISGSTNGTYRVSGAPTDTSDGGAASVTLTANEIPAHTHGSVSLVGVIAAQTWSNGAPSGIVTSNYVNYNLKSAGTGNQFGTHNQNINASHEHSSVGGGQAHNNMPPYIIVNRWHRTA